MKKNSNRKDGSILVYSFLMIMTMGVMAVALANLHNRVLLGQAKEIVYIERAVDIGSAKNILQAAAVAAFAEEDLSTITTSVTQIEGALALDFPDFSMSAVTNSNGVPFLRTNGFAPIARNRPNDAFERSSHVLRHDFSALVTFSGEKAGANSDTIGAFQAEVDCSILEMPTVNFQLVTYAEAFEGSLVSNLLVDGTCLFVEGVGGGWLESLSVNGYSLSMGNASGLSPHRFGQVNKGSVLTWGLTSMGDLFAESGTGITEEQSFLLEAPTELIVVEWEDPTIAPALPLPLGVTYETFDGAPRLIVDFASLAESSHYQFKCSGGAENNGIVIIGDDSGLLSSVSIVTNSKVSIQSDNQRVCLIASNYQGNHAIYSELYLDGISGVVAGDTVFTGYFFFEQNDLVFSTDENWTGIDFEIIGSLVFRGGSISGPDQITITRNSDFINFLSNGQIKSDRFAYIGF